MVDDRLQDSLEGISASKWIAFSGSAESNLVMDNYAVRAVSKALMQKQFIMVGDNPKGVDWAILNYLLKQNVDRMQYTVCTAVGEQPRSVERYYGHDFTSKRRFEDYQNRDFNMVDFADVTMCIWNGKSKGAKGTFDYARATGKLAYLVTFDAQGNAVLEKS